MFGYAVPPRILVPSVELAARSKSKSKQHNSPAGPRSRSRSGKQCCKLPADCKVDTSSLKRLVSAGEALENLIKVQGILRARQEELRQLRVEISDLRGQLEYEDACNTDLKSQLTSLLREVQSRESMFGKKSQNHAVIIENRREKIMDIDQRIVAHDLQRDELESQVSRSNSILGELLTRISLIKVPVGVEESLANHIRHEDQKRNSQEAYLREAELEKHKVGVRSRGLLEELNSLEDLSSQLGAGLSVQSSQISSLTASISARKATLAELNTSTSTLKHELGRVSDSLAAEQHTEGRLKMDVSNSTAELSRIILDAENAAKRAQKARNDVQTTQNNKLQLNKQKDAAEREFKRVKQAVESVDSVVNSGNC